VSTSKNSRVSPTGVGIACWGGTVGDRNNQKHGRGDAYRHHTVDDHCRLAHSEILARERKQTAAAFRVRAKAMFNEQEHRGQEGAHRQRIVLPVEAVRPYPRSDIAQEIPAPTARKPTARSSDSTAPSTSNGPTPRPTSPIKPAQRPIRGGCITTTTTDPAPASAERHLSTAYAITPSREEQLDRVRPAPRCRRRGRGPWRRRCRRARWPPRPRAAPPARGRRPACAPREKPSPACPPD